MRKEVEPKVILDEKITTIPTIKTKPVKKRNPVQKSPDTSICLHFLSQIRLLTFGLLIIIFIKVVQILEIVRNTNFCS